MRHAMLLAACSAVVLTVMGAAQAAPVNIPNYDFSVGTYNTTTVTPTYYNGGGTTAVQQTASISGWDVTVNPMTFNGGVYYNYTPYATVWNNGWYGSGANGQAAFFAVFGGEPNANYYWTGGPTNPVNHDRFLLTDESAILTSTGITNTTVAGGTYTATMAVGGSSWSDLSWVDAVKPTYTINLLVDGNVVSSGIVANPAFDVWTDVSTAPYVATSSGQSIQVQMVATNFRAANWFPFSTGFATVSDARLTEVVPEPTTIAMLGLTGVGLLVRRRNDKKTERPAL